MKTPTLGHNGNGISRFIKRLSNRFYFLVVGIENWLTFVSSLPQFHACNHGTILKSE